MTECIDTIGFIFQKSRVQIKCYKTDCYRYKLSVFKLSKSDFISSTLDISTNINDAWLSLKNNIINLINSDFIISVTKCNKLHSFGAKLVKVKKFSCCDDISLYFNFNIVPSVSTTCNYTNSICIPLTSDSNIPTVSCYPENYWPDPESNIYNSPCANIAGNFFYNLENGTYYDVKFYYSNTFCNTPCFKSVLC